MSKGRRRNKVGGKGSLRRMFDKYLEREMAASARSKANNEEKPRRVHGRGVVSSTPNVSSGESIFADEKSGSELVAKSSALRSDMAPDFSDRRVQVYKGGSSRGDVEGYRGIGSYFGRGR